MECTVDRCVVTVERVDNNHTQTPVGAEAVGQASPCAVLKLIESRYSRIPCCFRNGFVGHCLSIRQIDRCECCIVCNFIDVVHSLIKADNAPYIVCLKKDEPRYDIEFTAPDTVENVYFSIAKHCMISVLRIKYYFYYLNLPWCSTAFLSTQAPLWCKHVVAGCTCRTVVHEKRISEDIVDFNQAESPRCCS